MTAPPLVSVVIPSHNTAPDELARAVSSVLRQSLGDLEVIVVDDGSTPPLTLPDAAADNRVRIVRHATNSGAGSARNTGAREARGEWLAFLDSDDAWHPTKLARQLAAAEKIDPSRLAAHVTGWRYIDKGRVGRALIPVPAGSLFELSAGCWFCPGSALLMRRRDFERVGPQDENLTRLEDYDWFLRFGALGGELLVLPEVLIDIHRSKRPAAERVRSPGRQMAAKFLDPKSPDFIADPGVQRRIRAYLALTEASAALFGQEFLSGGVALLRSYFWVPRTRYQIERLWWTPDASAAPRAAHQDS